MYSAHTRRRDGSPCSPTPRGAVASAGRMSSFATDGSIREKERILLHAVVDLEQLGQRHGTVFVNRLGLPVDVVGRERFPVSPTSNMTATPMGTRRVSSAAPGASR